MARERHPVDRVADDLVAVYARGIARLEALVRSALHRGLDPNRLGTPEQRRGDATAAYRQRQLDVARAILRDLDNAAGASGAITRDAYASSIIALDRSLAPRGRGKPGLTFDGRFGGVHQRQVSVLADNLERSLKAAVGRTGSNLELVFARAAALDGALPVGGLPGAPRFIGRRENDAWRELALKVVGEGLVAGDVRRAITANLERRLITDGVTDALTGFVDKAGRRWSLDRYTEVVVRTLTREASSRALLERMDEHGEDLVSVSAHPHKHDVCSPYDGKTFSRSGRDRRYPRLVVIPPFHVLCRHVLGPGGGLLDDYERELGLVAGGPSTSGPRPGSGPNEAPPAPRPRPARRARSTDRPVKPPRRSV